MAIGSRPMLSGKDNASVETVSDPLPLRACPAGRLKRWRRLLISGRGTLPAGRAADFVKGARFF